MRRIYVVGTALNYANWMQGELVESIDESDLVVFTGGEDVDPGFYNEKQHPAAFTNPTRDRIEVSMFKQAVSQGKKIWGTCRGSQLSCVMAGGRLVQHQDNPNHFHEMKTYDGREIRCNSTHHQAQFPFNLTQDKYRILAWTENMLPFHQDGEQKEMNPPKEVEICYYPEIKALACQPHPESMPHTEFQDYCRELLDKHMNNEL